VRSKVGKSTENASCYSLISAAGLIVVKHDISQAFITGISCAILTLLFLVQRFGTSKVGGSFAPVVIIWLAINLLFGIYVSFAGSWKFPEIADNAALAATRTWLSTTIPS
jgi:K+ transporter